MIATSVAKLLLREIATDDARELFTLIQDNREHLTAQGDYADLVVKTYSDIQADLAKVSGRGLNFAIEFNGQIVGRLDLVPVDPPRYGIGYWLRKDATGKGYATTAIDALAEHARSTLVASDLYAGVTHGNEKSVAVLKRAGFHQVADLGRYARFHRSLSFDGPSAQG